MASQPFALLEPFWANPGEGWFRKAYKWNRDQIYDWMKKTADAGGVQPGDQDLRTLLTEIYNRLISLSLEKGSLYKDITKQPSSHIARLMNRDWKKEDETSSKFIVSGWYYRHTPRAVLGPVPQWWCPFDLLGLFLSLLGPAPASADKNNFYLPLTAVYGRWCSRIAGAADEKWKWKPSIEGEGELPFVFQCTWYLQVDKSTRQHWGQYFLGASNAGDKFETDVKLDTYTGAWRERAQEARFDMLFRCQKVPMVQVNDFKNKTAPNMEKKADRNMVPYGNCAETYPFAIRFLADKKQNQTSMTGLALKSKFMEKAEYPDYEEYSTSDVWKNLMAPCANCKVLLQNAGALESQFAANLDKAKAPKRPKSMLEGEELLVENGSLEKEKHQALLAVS
ncbi:hypothetical protein Focb16_v008069 [Fusarium oxysporum f. sp. cubense]|uniref:Uncharacterized protein n=1 Tax=Fusarium oxysporum f. sp. cubense TaxID=61366 RepID=A0A559LQB3_FUSOC|nr:hypothetical protein Focb16_v008069 [Fusarium oxysporum f. sp. cubense]